MLSEDRIKQQRELVGAIGRMFEKQGFGLIPGRILGLLMVMDQEQYTFDEIIEELRISKSSASNALRILEARDLIEYVMVKGNRKRYFQIRKQDKFSIVDDHLRKLKITHDLLLSILELKADKESANAIFMRDVKNMVSFFLDKFDELKAEYHGEP